MKYAVFADIHGNLEALKRAAEYVETNHLSHIVCLGDSVGYGADPNKCLEWACKHSALHVLGNHEAAVIHEKIRWEFNDWARVAIDWTADQLRPDLVKKIKDLPYTQTQEAITLAHGTIHSPEAFRYLFDLPDAHKSFLALQTTVGFVGHSHIPCFFSEKEAKGERLAEGILKLNKKDRYLLNPGSIGQPRDRDPRLSFGIYDPEELTFEIVRLPYDNKKAAQKIRAEGLPKMLADRLL